MVGAKTLLPPLGLLTVAALLPRDWDLRLTDLNVRELTEEDWQWAEMVMLTGMHVQREGLLAALQEAKKRGKITVVGGPHVTLFSDEELRNDCNFLFVGEAENTIQNFLDALKEGKDHGVFSCEDKPDISKSPVPRFDLIDYNDYASLTIQVSRGCPFDCEFCDIGMLYGRKMRYKTPEQVTQELEVLCRSGFGGEVFISDDNFIGSRTHARAILTELISWSKSRGEPFGFVTQVSVNLGQDLEMIDLMTEANFTTVFIGIETPDENVLVLNRKFQNVKNPLVESVNNITENGLSVIGSFIIGFDGEEKGAGERICAFAEETKIPILMVNVLMAPLQTRLWDRLEKEGRLLLESGARDGIRGVQNFVPDRSSQEIKEEFVTAWEYLYEPARFLERTYQYHLMMRPTRSALAHSQGLTSPDHNVHQTKAPLRRRLRDLGAFFRLVWRQGIRRSYRVQFWKQLTGILRHNRSRTVKYLVSCVYGEAMFGIAGDIRTNVWAHADVVRTENRGCQGADTEIPSAKGPANQAGLDQCPLPGKMKTNG